MLRDANGDTPLIAATKSNNIEVIRQFISFTESSAGIIAYKDSRGYNLLHIAAEMNDVALLKFLISQIKQWVWVSMLSARDIRTQSTPVLLAITLSHFEFAEALLKTIAMFNNNNNNGGGALSLDFINLTNIQGNTALHVAAIKRQLQLVKLLLTLGASISIRNKDNKTAEALIKKIPSTRGEHPFIDLMKEAKAAAKARGSGSGTINSSPTNHNRNNNHDDDNNNNNSGGGDSFLQQSGEECQGQGQTHSQDQSQHQHQHQHLPVIEFEDILADPLPRSYLRQLCVQEYSVENFDFLLEVAQYQKHVQNPAATTREKLARAQHIYDLFVKKNAEHELNIEDLLRMDVREKLQRLTTAAATPTAGTAAADQQLHDSLLHIFDLTNKAATYTLFDTYMRFLRHDLYREYWAEVKALTTII